MGLTVLKRLALDARVITYNYPYRLSDNGYILPYLCRAFKWSSVGQNGFTSLSTRKFLSYFLQVNVDLDLEIVQHLQHGHGGWTDGMFECLGQVSMLQNFLQP